jgi:uncharacterized protein (TIGR04255 family)
MRSGLGFGNHSCPRCYQTLSCSSRGGVCPFTLFDGYFVTRLAKAPLLEVATQIRWGNIQHGENGEQLRYVYSASEQTELPQALSEAFTSAGFVHREAVAKELEDVPFAVSQRYRHGVDAWPVYQSGLGLFSVNESNDNYDWDAYKDHVLRGIELLSAALNGYYPDGIPFVGMEMTYVDRFLLEEGERPDAFLMKKLSLQYTVPPAFTGAPFIESSLSAASLSFDVNVNKPQGRLSVALDYTGFSGRSGYIMETSVLSLGSDINYTQAGIAEWLEAAHTVQSHAFHTLIEPDYHRSFQ